MSSKAFKEVSESSNAQSTDEAVGRIEGKIAKAALKESYIAINKYRSRSQLINQDKNVEQKAKSESSINKESSEKNNRLINRGSNEKSGRLNNKDKKGSNKNKAPGKKEGSSKAKSSIKKGKKAFDKTSAVKDTLDGNANESIDEGVARVEGKAVKSVAKRSIRPYKAKKKISNIDRTKGESKKTFERKSRYSLNKDRGVPFRSSKDVKSLQKKALQKKYHYSSTNKLIAISPKNQAKEVSKGVAKSASSKMVTAFKKAGSAIKSAISSKVVLAGGAITLVLGIIFISIVLIVSVLSSGIAEVAYVFTPDEATRIQQRYQERELDYLEMIYDEAEPYIGDYNATIEYDAVGHDPHELMSLFNVLFLYEMSSRDRDEFVYDEDLIDDIIKEIIDSRYKFEKTTEEIPTTIVIANPIGEDRIIDASITKTLLRSQTMSISNLISGATFNTPANTKEFINFIAEDAREIAGDNDLYASVMMAQAILETGSGSSGLGKAPHFNLFGIKGSYNGEYATMLTEEDDGTGTRYTISSQFRSYPSYRESMEDYATVMLEQPRPGFYSRTYKRNSNSYRDATAFLQGTYATDTQYASKLNSIIESNNLTQYDTPSNRKDSTAEDGKRIILERELGGNLLALTEYEKELYKETLEWRGLMGSYQFPVDQKNWARHIKEPYGLAWNESSNKRYNTKGLLVNVNSDQNVSSPVSGKVTQANSNSVTIRSEGTLVFEIKNIKNVNVSRNSVVRKGDVIGKTTNEGILLNARTARRLRRDLPINPQLIFYSESTQPITYSTRLSQFSVAPDTSGWLRPASGRVSSPFGYRIHPIFGIRRFHRGIDIAGSGPIVAARAGRVTTAQYHNSYGYYVVIDHGDGYRSLYAHLLSNLQVRVGDQVEQGQRIGTMGSTGDSTGVHLHFEIHDKGNYVDPANYIKF